MNCSLLTLLRSILKGLAIVLLLMVLLPGAAVAETCILQEEAQAIRCGGNGEEPGFAIYHAPVEQFYGAPLRAPIVAGGRHFYAHGSDLLEIDVEAKAVVSRYRFPAPIRSLTPESNAVLVSLVTEEEEDIPARYRLDGSTPERLTWDWRGTQVALGDARNLLAIFQNEPSEKLETAEGLQSLFQLASKRDRTNPFYEYYLGRALQERNEQELARQAFLRAATTEGAVWSDLTRLWVMFQAAGAQAAAERAFSRIEEKIQAAAFDGQDIHSVLVFVLVFLERDRDPGVRDDWRVVYPDILARAIADDNLAQIISLLAPVAETFPNLEFGPSNYRLLAEYFRANGEQELAGYWEDRAFIAGESPLQSIGPGSTFWKSNWRVYFSLVFGFSLTLTCLLMGLRQGGRRRRLGQKLSWQKLLPEFVVLLTLGFGLSMVANHLIQEARIYNEVASITNRTSYCFFDGCFGVPQTLAELRALYPSPERDALIEYALLEQEALKEGRLNEMALPGAQVRFEALFAHARQVVEQAQLMPVLASHGLAIFIYGVQWAFLFFLGYLLAALIPGVGWVSWRLLPGGSESLALISFIPVSLFVAGVAGLLGVGEIFYRLGAADYLKYLGFEALAESYQVRFFTNVFVLAIVSAVAIQAVGVIRDLRR